MSYFKVVVVAMQIVPLYLCTRCASKLLQKYIRVSVDEINITSQLDKGMYTQKINTTT